MSIKGFKLKDGSVQKYDYSALEDIITDPSLSRSGVAADGQATGNAVMQAMQAAINADDRASDVENSLDRFSNRITSVEQSLFNYVDGGFVENGVAYFTSNGEVLFEITGIGGGGGGGGGGDYNNAVLTVTNSSGWLSKTIASGESCPISITWSSLEDDMPTGDGSMRVTVNGSIRSTTQIRQGVVTTDLLQYLGDGANVVRVQISDIYGNARSINFSVTVVAISISSSFDPSQIYSSSFAFNYIPVGAVEKLVYFFVDGVQIGTKETSVSGRQLTQLIPAQSHGSHTIKVYFEATINGETVRSNELFYGFTYVDPTSNVPIITSSFNQLTWSQYSSIPFTFTVYTPSSLTSDVDLYIDEDKIASLTVDRTEQSYVYRANNYGSLTFKIQTGAVIKTFNLTITESEIDVEAETRDLVLYLTSQGRSNQEENPGTWVSDINGTTVSATMTGFNYASDGWVVDNDGISTLRVSGNARVTIPFKPFERDFRTTGKTIEIEFATRNVIDYDATILSCISGNRGIKITPQKATLTSEQSEISMQYKEDEHIRVSFVVEKRSENRLLMAYIDSVPSGVVVYPTDDDFSQVSPVNISIGSSDCAIDIYAIRVYDNDLTRNQILDNWIADTQIGSLMLDRYTRNAIYDAYGKVIIANLPSTLPYYILSAEELPQYKGDKKTISGSYTDPLHPSKSFTFTGCQINVQGTSSAPYARKNYDLQFKKGFDMSSGAHESNYALRDGAIPFNRFVLKADVASSEGANNVELVRLYNDACPYKTLEMQDDDRVRWGIDGFPIVVFWNDTATGTTSFLGKYNFNLPKRAPAPYGYANDDTMESWEFQNNTSDLMIFKSDYFDETMTPDPDTGDMKELWRYDYEARFPSDEWTNYAILQEFQSFVYSTYRAEATGDNLSSSVTYDGVTYTKDTADYRLAKFKAEFPTYAELSSFIFYYIFTELFLMVDSRAKNLFIGFNGSPVTAEGRVATRKATAQPYDMDTAIGTNNEGSLVFSYGLEDTDHLSGGANIFNGQESVLWCNVRDAFDAEIRQMYQQLRSTGVLSYSTIEERFELHQEKWPEAIWIEDSWFKYIDPLINPDPGKEPTAVYLPMMQGSKEQQRKWWLVNRFKYMDSKWNAGDALSQVIQLRGYAKANITVTPYTDIYPTVKYASYVVQERGTHGQPTTLVCPNIDLNDTEIYIYSAPQIASVGDLAPLKVGFADFSKGTRLQSIKIGDSASSYSNQNLYSLSLGSNVLLKTLDVRNCSGLGDTTLEGHTQTVVDISGCEIIENVYFEGTKIQGLTLPNGGVLKVLHLPATMTNLTILNQPHITDFSIPSYANVSTLRLENVPTLNTKTILNTVPANTRVRLIGFYWTATDATEIEALLDKLDTMRGLDEQGNNVETAQVSGEIHTASLTGAQIASYNQRYPYLRITADHTSSTLRFYNGTTLLTSQTVLDGGNGSYNGSTPTKAQDAQYTYTFAGWSKDSDDNTVDGTALTNVVADRNVYACYTQTLRKYTVTWKNADGTTLETDTNVPYGTMPTYDGPTPTSSDGNFSGWEPSITGVTDNAIYIACYEIVIVEPDLKYLVYELDEVNKTITISQLNYEQIKADGLTTLTIPDTINGYSVVLYQK